jgi:hypothetical protein
MATVSVAKKQTNPTADALQRATDEYNQNASAYQSRVVAGGSISDAIQRALNEADPSLTQLRTAKADISKKLGTVFADSMDSLKDVTDPRIREQIRARQSAEYGSEAEKLGGMVSDVGASRDKTVDKFSNIFNAGTAAEQFGVEQKKSALDRAITAGQQEDQRKFESRMDDLTRREKEASIAAANRSNRGGAGGLTDLQLLGLQDTNPLGLAKLKGYERKLAPDGGKGYWFYDKDGKAVSVDEVANAIGGNKAALLEGSTNEADQALIKTSSGKSPLSAAAQKDVNSINDALNVLGKIETSSKAVNTSSGTTARGMGAVTSLMGYLGKNADATRFRQNVGYLSRIVRAMGEVGTLNEGDIGRAQKLIPAFTDTKEEAQNKLNDLRDILTKNKQQRENGPDAGQGTVIDLSAFEQS